MTPLIIAFSAVNAPAKEKTIAVVTVGDSIAGQSLGPFMEVFENSNQQYSVEEVTSEQFVGRYKKSEKEIPNWGLRTTSPWVRFDLRNAGQQPKTLYIELRYAAIDRLSLYQRERTDGDAKLIQTLGDRVAFNQRRVQHRHPVFVIELLPGTTHFYGNLSTLGGQIFPLYLWTPKEFNSFLIRDTAFLGLIFGFLMVMAVYNFLIALFLKSRAYTCYVAFIMGGMLFQFSYSGMGQQVFEPTVADSWFSNKGFIVGSQLTTVFGGLFTFFFLDLRVRFPGLANIFIPFLWINLLSMVYFLLGGEYGVAAKITNISTLFLSVSVTYFAVKAALMGFRPAWFFSVAWMIFLIFMNVSALSFFGIIEFNPAYLMLIFVGQAIEVILLSLALGDRVRRKMRDDKHQIEALNDDLKKNLSHNLLKTLESRQTDH